MGQSRAYLGRYARWQANGVWYVLIHTCRNGEGAGVFVRKTLREVTQLRSHLRNAALTPASVAWVLRSLVGLLIRYRLRKL